MNKKNVQLCITLFALTVLASIYYNIERPLRTLSINTFNMIPLAAFHVIFPFVWGIILFALVYCLRIGEKSIRRARMTIEAVFLLANILSLCVYFYMYYTFTTYTLILTGLLFAGIIFEIIQVFVSKRIPVSPIEK